MIVHCSNLSCFTVQINDVRMNVANISSEVNTLVSVICVHLIFCNVWSSQVGEELTVDTDN